MIVRRLRVLACVSALAALLPLLHGRAQESPARPASVRVNPAEASRTAEETRRQVNVELAPGMELQLWASERLIADPVAISIDARGTAYVASTSRSSMPLDIRGHRDWVPVVHTLRTNEQLQAFYRRVMAPERGEQNPWIADLNGDGSRDIRDYTELKERVVRLRDTNGDGVADAADTLVEGFNHDPTWDVIGSVAQHEGDLFVGVPPGVYRLPDANRPGLLKRQVTISEGYNTHPAFGGHGISGVMVGPDGRLYWEVGDMGFHVTDKSGRTWSYPNQGAVLRSELDGSNFEVFARGIRNLQEFAFDEHGNLISVDNDGDHPGETERVVYLPYGTDSGWRSTWQYGKYTDPKNNRYNVWMEEGMFKTRHAGQTSSILPPVAPWHAGPSGMAYNPGTALTEDWRGHFFAVSFAGAPNTARVYGFRLKEDGAGFAMDQERLLLRGILVVGLTIGPDGAMYITDWITGWETKNSGRIWKIDAPGAASTPMRREVQSLLAANFADRSPADLAALLRHVDMRVRQKAQFDLVRRADVRTLLSAAEDPADRRARLHALWGIGQLARKDAAHAERLVPFVGDADGEVRAQAARLLGDVRHRSAADRLIPLLKDAAPRVRFFAAEALGRMAHRPATGAIVGMLAENSGRDVYLHHAGSLALASMGDGAALEALATHVSADVRIAAVTALRRMRHAGVARFLADADERVVTDAARAINDDGSIPEAVPALAAILGRTPFANEPLLRRAINANLREGAAESVGRVAAFAAESTRPEELRVEAISALGVWPEPSPLDRVDGAHHDQIDVGPGASGSSARVRSGVAEARMAVQRLLERPSDGAAPPSAIRAAVAEAAGRLGLTSAAPVLTAQLRSDADPAVRLASLNGLRSLKVADLNELMGIAIKDADANVRRAALGILTELDMPPAAKVEHLTSILASGSLVEQQGALEVLGSLRVPESRALLGRTFEQLAAGSVAPELHVDLVEAIAADGSQELASRVEAFQQSRNASSPAAAFREGLLAGGSPRRGYQVALENPVAQCARCHTFFGQGSDVGPELSRIGASLTREQILEALLEPNARIAPGFGVVSVALKNGERVEGTLREETESRITLLVGAPPVERVIVKSDVAERTDPVSAMPPLGLVLNMRELRDVVAFLSALK